MAVSKTTQRLINFGRSWDLQTMISIANKTSKLGFIMKSRAPTTPNFFRCCGWLGAIKIFFVFTMLMYPCIGFKVKSQL
ncbi:hypothetical protein CR513_59003, partial [Mucuna pruriens]